MPHPCGPTQYGHVGQWGGGLLGSRHVAAPGVWRQQVCQCGGSRHVAATGVAVAAAGVAVAAPGVWRQQVCQCPYHTRCPTTKSAMRVCWASCHVRQAYLAAKLGWCPTSCHLRGLVWAGKLGWVGHWWAAHFLQKKGGLGLVS